MKIHKLYASVPGILKNFDYSHIKITLLKYAIYIGVKQKTVVVENTYYLSLSSS